MEKHKIIIIDIFLDTDYKIKIFEKTLDSIKKLNLPIMVKLKILTFGK